MAKELSEIIEMDKLYFIGRWIVEEQQQGKSRAKYGKRVIKSLSEALTAQYGRLALSREKDEVKRLESEGNVITKPQDIVKQLTVLEFLGLDEKARYVESDLETAIINKLQKFLLELGKTNSA